MPGTMENADGEQTPGKFENDKDPLVEDEEEGNLAAANPNLVEEPEGNGLDIHDNVNNHLRTMSEYKNWIKGLMDISLLTANANQMRQAFDLCEPFRTLLVLLLSLSITLQLVASCLLVLDHLAAKANNFALCRRCPDLYLFLTLSLYHHKVHCGHRSHCGRRDHCQHSGSCLLGSRW